MFTDTKVKKACIILTFYYIDYFCFYNLDLHLHLRDTWLEISTILSLEPAFLKVNLLIVLSRAKIYILNIVLLVRFKQYSFMSNVQIDTLDY